MAVVRCVRAYPARLSVAQHRDLSLLRFRRPFADTGGDLSPTPAATFRCQRPNPFQLRCIRGMQYRSTTSTTVLYTAYLQYRSEALKPTTGNSGSGFKASVPRLRDPTGAYRLLLGSVLESIMIGDSVFRRQPTSALNLRLGRKYTWRLTHAGNASQES